MMRDEFCRRLGLSTWSVCVG